MKSFLAVHRIEEVTARVPFSMMLLLDAAQRKTLPPNVTLRCVLPTDGTLSTSVWEAEDRDVLAAALESLLGSFCETELFDVVEEHVYSRGMDAKCSSAAAGGGAASGDTLGLSKVTAAGAAFATTSMEKISSAARYTSQATASGMNSLNERYHVVDKAKSAKEATASFFTKVGANIKERSNSLFKKDATPTPDAANTTAPTPAADVNPSAEGMNAAPVSTPAQQEEQPVPVPMGSEATT